MKPTNTKLVKTKNAYSIQYNIQYTYRYTLYLQKYLMYILTMNLKMSLPIADSFCDNSVHYWNPCEMTEFKKIQKNSKNGNPIPFWRIKIFLYVSYIRILYDISAICHQPTPEQSALLNLTELSSLALQYSHILLHIYNFTILSHSFTVGAAKLWE